MSSKHMGDMVTFGQYRVLQRDNGSLWELGRSAMGVTYKAADTDLQRPVALKVINSDLVADEANRESFLREARAAAGLRHSNVASAYHLGKDGEQFFYATEFVQGQTIESYVARYGPLPLRAALHVAWQVSKALVAATKQQLAHREVSPANIMIVDDPGEGGWPFVKLINLGLAPSARGANAADGTPSAAPGAAQAAGPERGEHPNLDTGSDIYSLGCTLWYLLTGQGPFTGSASGDIARQPFSETPWACRLWNLLRGEAPYTGSVSNALAQEQPGNEPAWEKLEAFPKPVRHLLRQMLRKEFSQRPTRAMEVQREIEQCLAEVERREALAAKITLPLSISRHWLSGAPWTRRAAIFGASAVGLLVASGYLWNDDAPAQSAPARETSEIVQAEDPANSGQLQAKEFLEWSYLAGWDEPFRSFALAPLLSFAEPITASPGIVGAKTWRHAESIWDSAVVAQGDSSSAQRGARSSAAIASNSRSAAGKNAEKKVAVAASEEKKVAVRKASTPRKSEVRKTPKRYAYANYPQQRRRVITRTRHQGFNPMRMVQRARYHIKRAIHQIF